MSIVSLVMDLDVVLQEIGEFGKYQKFNYFLLCLPVFFSAANCLAYVFLAGTQKYRLIVISFVGSLLF